MISFSALGMRSRLGNHLFQYAFLRTAARRLGVKFYCPEWIGDSVFHLGDRSERAGAPAGVVSEYKEPYEYTGLNESALCIEDGTNIQGYFQTEKYLDREAVCRWYRFRQEKIERIRKRYDHVDFANSVGLSVRLGDFVTTYGDLFYVPRLTYYRCGLELVRRKETVIVFSDDIQGAKALLRNLGAPTVYTEGYEPYEGIYLQSQCRDFICSPSTYSWWGAWLNTYPDRIIVAPKEGAFRPGAPVKNHDFWPENWIKVAALCSGMDHYRLVVQKRRLERALGRVMRLSAQFAGRR